MYKYNTSEGESFTFPNSLRDITLRQYIEFMELVEPTKPKELLDVENASLEYHTAEKEIDIQKAEEHLENCLAAITSKVMYRKVYPYYARVVAFFSDGLTEAKILGGKKQGDGMNLGNLQHLYNTIVTLLSDPEEPEYSPVIMVDNELWYLPMRFMEKAKLIEYAEASQFEENVEKLNQNQWSAIAKIMCVLVRKEGEQYSDKLLAREQMFLSWNLEDCFRVSFFLLKRSEISILSFQAFTAAQDLSKLKLESNN
jgi:hypothetical protein